jgi:hypothetical protein
MISSTYIQLKFAVTRRPSPDPYLRARKDGEGPVTIISSQGQEIDIKILDRGDDQQCALMDDREQ